MAGKEFACNVGDLGLIPGVGRSPGEGKGYPLQYSGLENSMDCRVHGVTKSHDWVTFSHMETTCILKSKTGTAKPRPWNYTQHLRIKLPDLTMSASICALSWFSSRIPGGSVVENLPAMQETWVQSLDGEDPLEKGMATHSSIFSWRVAWTEEPGRLQSMGSVAQCVTEHSTPNQLPKGFTEAPCFGVVEEICTCCNSAEL